jgi:hypothetical protein
MYQMIKLFKDFDINNLIFKPLRKTATGSRIIDIENQEIYQTCWLKILYDVEYNICVEADKIKEILEQIDTKIVDYSSEKLDFSKTEILRMYRPLLKSSSNSYCFSVPISTNTVLFDSTKKFYNKAEMKDILKSGQNIRFIFKFKKIYFKDHELTLPLELLQIELA